MRVLLGGSSNDQGKGFDSLSRWVPQRGGYNPKGANNKRLFMLKWLGKHNYTLNMFHDERENCSIIAMVLREMDDWVRHALLRRTGVFINQVH